MSPCSGRTGVCSGWTGIRTDDRPLADTAAKMKQLYQVREPVYRAAADEIIPVSGTPEDTAQNLLQH